MSESDIIVVPGVTLWSEQEKEEYMAARNSLQAKQQRRVEREDRKARVEKKRKLQERINYLAYSPPDTFEELEAEVNRLTDEANQ